MKSGIFWRGLTRIEADCADSWGFSQFFADFVDWVGHRGRRESRGCHFRGASLGVAVRFAHRLGAVMFFRFWTALEASLVSFRLLAHEPTSQNGWAGSGITEDGLPAKTPMGMEDRGYQEI